MTACIIFAGFVLSHSSHALEVSDVKSWRSVERRAVVGGAFFVSANFGKSKVAAAAAQSRLDASTLEEPSFGASRSENLHFPDYMEGEWCVTQTLMAAEAPLGPRLLGGPRGDEKIGAIGLARQRDRIGAPVEFRLRFLRTANNFIIEDRIFNQRMRSDAFAGKKVVADVSFAEDQSFLPQSKIEPPTTTVTQFRGPAAQKVFSLASGRLSTDESSIAAEEKKRVQPFRAFEFQRTIFQLTNTAVSPPITTDSEIIWELEPSYEDQATASAKSDIVVRGRFRLADYLNPNDALFFEARRRAVSISDYSLAFRRCAVPSYIE